MAMILKLQGRNSGSEKMRPETRLWPAWIGEEILISLYTIMIFNYAGGVTHLKYDIIVMANRGG